MIYINNQVSSEQEQEIFWTWFVREFPNSSFEIPKKLDDSDILLRHATLGYLPVEGKQLALCWDFCPEIADSSSKTYFDEHERLVESAAKYSTYRTVTSGNTGKRYEKYGRVEVIPTGVDTSLYRPLKNKRELRKKYGLPQNAKIGIWVGTYHPIKGVSKLLEYAAINRDVEWIIVWEQETEKPKIDGAFNFVKIDQRTKCELFNASDLYLSTSQQTQYCTSEWEAMATNIKFTFYGCVEREFYPSSSPRDDVFAIGWDRKSTKRRWMEFFENKGIKW